MEKPALYILNFSISDIKNIETFFKELYKIDSEPFELLKFKSFAIKTRLSISDIFNSLATSLDREDLLLIVEIRVRPESSSLEFKRWLDS